MNKTPHKHAALIKQWADGATIQKKIRDDEWHSHSTPLWHADKEYRVKPEPKPDVVVYSYHGKGIMCSHGCERHSTPNVKFTYDGETGKLKAVELL